VADPAAAIGACGGGEVVRTFNVTETYDVGAVSLGFNADHPQRDELQVTLESPEGISVTLVAPPEGSLMPFANYDVLLSDSATNGLHDFHGDDDTALPYYDRLSRPYEPLNAFFGKAATGDWTLTICDTDASGNDGTYNRSQLILEYQNPAVTEGDWFATFTGLDGEDHISHTLTAAALDLAGNRSETITLTVWVDNVAPTLTISESVATAHVDVSVRAVAGTTGDSGKVQTMYANVHTPSGNRVTMQVSRDGDPWWFEFTPKETGTYTIWINAQEQGGNTTTAGSFSLTVIGLAVENDSPTALGAATTFTATIVGDSGYTYDWDFCDQFSVIGHPSPAISHTYGAVNVYTATVTARKGTAVFTGTTQVVVDEAIAGLTASNDSPTPAGNATTLTSTLSAGTNATYKWDFGDGQPSATDDQPVASHKYPGGLYTAIITATNSVSVMTAATVVRVGMIVTVTPDDGATLVYTDAQGLTTTVEVPAGAVDETIILV
jgi:subtilisin-like proprotein convertase family protein